MRLSCTVISSFQTRRCVDFRASFALLSLRLRLRSRSRAVAAPSCCSSTPTISGRRRSTPQRFRFGAPPPWQYDPVYGYGYVPALKIDDVQLAGGIVTGCGQFGVANEQGNLGPPVPDFNQADFKIVVFGDSFAGAYATGPASTKMLGEKLEGTLGRTVRVLNMARDGYGMPQIIALANGKLKELRPSLIVFAFNGPSLERARYWRTTVGSGDDTRLYASIENSPNPDPETAADAAIVMTSPTRGWCEEQVKKSPEDRTTRSNSAKDTRQASRDH